MAVARQRMTVALVVSGVVILAGAALAVVATVLAIVVVEGRRGAADRQARVIEGLRRISARVRAGSAASR